MANDTVAYRQSDGRNALNIDTNKTLAISDNGVVQNLVADGVIITLPATVLGYSFTIRNGGAKKSGAPIGTGDDGSVLVAIAPNASDMVVGGTWTGADNKQIRNTKSTSRVGDEISVVGEGAAATGWCVQNLIGIWAKEA